MTNSPQVKRMVMFKHGVAYLERGGPAEGSFELSFKREEMNDILKSLAVWVARGEARVGAVAFEAPEDPERALLERRLSFRPGEAMSGLLHSLRGRTISVNDGQRDYQGEVIGVETTAGGEQPPRRQLLLRLANGTIQLIDLATTRTIELIENPSRGDLQFIIDRTRAATAGDNRSITISIAGQAEDLRISYVIPSPIWRVSYRLTSNSDNTLLMAWGIVHNPTEEDLDAIELTLTTGQPVSFTIDLYNPKRVERAVVEEQSRTAAPPVRYQHARTLAAMPAVPAAAAPPPAPKMLGDTLNLGFGHTGSYPAPEFDETSMHDSFIDSTEGAASMMERGEFFEYRVNTPVSLKRGGSAMVPLVAIKLDAHKERIWRQNSGANPDLVLSFRNSTGVVLEEGPVVIYDAGAYAGEAMLPYSARGVNVKLGFAKDLAVRCRDSSNTNISVAGLRLGKDILIEEQRYEEHHSLWVENDHQEEVEVILELPKRFGRTIAPEGLQPFEQTESFLRFRVKVPPQSHVDEKLIERWLDQRNLYYQHISMGQLELWLKNRFLDQETYQALSEVLAAWEQANLFEQQRAQLERQQQAAYGKQTKITEQLSVLKENGPEGELRLRYVRELEGEQNKVNTCETEMLRLYLAAEEKRKTAMLKLSLLVGE